MSINVSWDGPHRGLLGSANTLSIYIRVTLRFCELKILGVTLELDIINVLTVVSFASREAAERVVAPLPPSQVEGESGGREWPAAGQGEAGVTQHGEGAAASARVSGDRGLETLPRGPTARGGFIVRDTPQRVMLVL